MIEEASDEMIIPLPFVREIMFMAFIRKVLLFALETSRQPVP